MVKEVLAPSMKDRKEPDLGTEVLGVGSDSPQSLCSCAEHNIVHGAGILECDRCDLVGYGENNVKILRIERLRLSASIHSARASDWHLGQLRERQLL